MGLRVSYVFYSRRVEKYFYDCRMELNFLIFLYFGGIKRKIEMWMSVDFSRLSMYIVIFRVFKVYYF